MLMGMLFIPKSLLIIATKEVRGSLRLQQFILSNVNERQTKISWQYSQLLRYSPDKQNVNLMVVQQRE